LTVPKLVLENSEDVKRFIEGMRLKDLRKQVRDQMDDIHTVKDFSGASELLRNERCILPANWNN